jgi:hypothetical protein
MSHQGKGRGHDRVRCRQQRDWGTSVHDWSWVRALPRLSVKGATWTCPWTGCMKGEAGVEMDSGVSLTLLAGLPTLQRDCPSFNLTLSSLSTHFLPLPPTFVYFHPLPPNPIYLYLLHTSTHSHLRSHFHTPPAATFRPQPTASSFNHACHHTFAYEAPGTGQQPQCCCE